MNKTELEAMRRLLFFSVAEAAELIGDVTPRSWQYWERGKREIPQDVFEKIKLLGEWRQSAIEALRSEIARANREQGGMPSVIELRWFEAMEDWIKTPSPGGEPRLPEYWRPHQSALAQILSEYGGAVLVI